MTESPFLGSQRLQVVEAPIIPAVAQWIRQVPGTISLGQGVVGYGPSPKAQEAAKAFGKAPGDHLYGPVAGDPDLLEAIRQQLLKEHGVDVGLDRCLWVTAGANMAFFHAIMAIADPGDEIILPLPWYFNQEMAVKMLGCVPVGVATRPHDHGLDIEAIRAAITPRTRAIVTVSPNNPTGAVYSEADLRALDQLARERGLFLVSDEAYDAFVWEGRRHFSPASIAGSADHTLAIYSMSKSYGLASWRVGYMVAPSALLQHFNKIQDTNLICPPRIAQRVAAASLLEGPIVFEAHRASLAEVREMVLEALSHAKLPLKFSSAEGAFYTFLTVDGDHHPMALTERLIREYGVAVIPGSAFGIDRGCTLRVAYGALEPRTVQEGIQRLCHGLGKILGSAG